MKKLFAILTALCLMCSACAALGDMEIPAWDSMPNVVFDADTSVTESAFEGEWVLDVAFLGREYISEQKLAGDYGFNFMPFHVGGGKVTQERQNEYGEFITLEAPYTFEAGQLQGQDGRGTQFAFDPLEDGNVVLSVFFPGEGDTLQCLSLFLKHPTES